MLTKPLLMSIFTREIYQAGFINPHQRGTTNK